ncbi:MAG: right-handed parallel beta-helix repeat-containing protein [Chloroflexi bacterium]|nr:right-handed parallel beta-helix repeat-containing protein [Chloroflexota bacterium]
MIRVFTAPRPHRDPGAVAPATRPRRLLTTLLLVATLALVLAGAPLPGVGPTGAAYAAAAATPSAPPTPSPHALRTAKNGAIPARTFNASHVQTPADAGPGRIIYVDRAATGVNDDVITNVAEFDGSAQTKPSATFTVLCVNSYTVTNGDDTGDGSLRQGIATVCDGSTISFSADTSIYLASELGINRKMAIDGTGHAVTVSGDTDHDGSPNVQPFNIGASGVVTLTHMTIVSGTAPSGGGIYNEGTLMVENSTLSGNMANQGGGIYTTGETKVISSTLSDNSASEYGGGMYVKSSTVNIENTVFSGNSAQSYGGGFYGDDGAHTTMTNVSFGGNSEPEVRSCAVFGDNSITLRNSILWSGSGAEELRTYEWYEPEPECTSTVDVTYSDIYQESSVYAGTGNQNVDPLYLSPATGDLRLATNSPVIDAGTNAACPPADLLGVARPQALVCDMGAYEVAQPLFMTKSVTPTNAPYHSVVTYTLLLSNPGAWGGAAWITDTLPAQVRFDQWIENDGAQATNDQITWHGTVVTSSLTFRFTATHVGDYNDFVNNVAQFNGPAQTQRAASFQVPCLNGYTVTNGNDSGPGSLRLGIAEVCAGSTISFSGDTSIYLASELDINRKMAIDGTGHAVTVSGDTYDDGSRDVQPFNIGASGVVTLTHMTIVSGTASSGGGIYNGGTLTVRNSTLTYNAAIGGGGGGAYNDGTLTVVNSTLSNNSASGNGGAILSSGSLTITSATVFSNTAGGNGGGIRAWGGATIERSTLSGNTANQGGGIYTTGKTKVISSTLSGNSASDYGGAIANYDYGNLTIEASTLMGNHTAYGGGGLYVYNWATTILLNSTIEGNSVDSVNKDGYGGGIDQNGGTLDARNSTITGNTASSGLGAGLVNWAGPLDLTNMVIAYNAGGDCRNLLPGDLDKKDNNLIGDTASWANCGIVNDARGNQVGIDPLLGPLADNGGPTLTRALLPESPAIDSGSTDCPAADQRGVPRSAGACDIGAFEAGAVSPAVAPVVAIRRSVGDTILSWTLVLTDTGGYEVWWHSTNPYFAPGASGAFSTTLLSATTSYTHTGTSGVNYFYTVLGINGAGQPSAPSNRTGRFHFTLAPGSP